MAEQALGTTLSGPSGCANESTKGKRDFEKCDQCRRDRQKCEWQWPLVLGARCQRCVSKGWQCSDRVRAPTAHANPGYFTDEFMVILAAQLMLSSCRYACQRIRFMNYPWPCSGLYNRGYSFWPKSQSLQEDFQLVASRWDTQIEALDKIDRGLLSYRKAVWANAGRSVRHISASARAIYACITGISPGGHDPQNANPGDEFVDAASSSPEDYVCLAHSIRRMLQTRLPGVEDVSNPVSRPLISTSDAFPASHIAFQNGAKDVAVELWRNAVVSQLLSPTEPGGYVAYPDSNVDLLGRTFPQLVAEAGDFETLWKIENIAGSAMLHANPDGRGLSLLALTICAEGKPDVGYIEKLLFRRLLVPSQPIGPGPCILDLALLSGNEVLVRTIVAHDVISTSYSRYAQKAIELGRADIAFCFVDWLQEGARVDQEEVRRLADVAGQKHRQLKDQYDNALQEDEKLAFNLHLRLKGFPELVRHLRMIVVRGTSAQQIVSNISNVNIP